MPTWPHPLPPLRAEGPTVEYALAAQHEQGPPPCARPANRQMRRALRHAASSASCRQLPSTLPTRAAARYQIREADCVPSHSHPATISANHCQSPPRSANHCQSPPSSAKLSRSSCAHATPSTWHTATPRGPPRSHPKAIQLLGAARWRSPCGMTMGTPHLRPRASVRESFRRGRAIPPSCVVASASPTGCRPPRQTDAS